jgi:hypothetical protein
LLIRAAEASPWNALSPKIFMCLIGNGLGIYFRGREAFR